MGILQRMPKPGPFASLACTLSEHLRARPKHFHLQGGTCFPLFSICKITNTMQSSAAKPLAFNSLSSNLNSFMKKAPDSIESEACHLVLTSPQWLRRGGGLYLSVLPVPYPALPAGFRRRKSFHPALLPCPGEIRFPGP